MAGSACASGTSTRKCQSSGRTRPRSAVGNFTQRLLVVVTVAVPCVVVCRVALFIVVRVLVSIDQVALGVSTQQVLPHRHGRLRELCGEHRLGVRHLARHLLALDPEPVGLGKRRLLLPLMDRAHNVSQPSVQPLDETAACVSNRERCLCRDLHAGGQHLEQVVCVQHRHQVVAAAKRPRCVAHLLPRMRGQVWIRSHEGHTAVDDAIAQYEVDIIVAHKRIRAVRLGRCPDDGHAAGLLVNAYACD
mmetsp:Transcript_16038/g.56016  ORF Transcript_16038/g.56016 Transcript_16038/m.56016 type:complete len:247 (+) Transcript_16038:865-1605(+)